MSLWPAIRRGARERAAHVTRFSRAHAGTDGKTEENLKASPYIWIITRHMVTRLKFTYDVVTMHIYLRKFDNGCGETVSVIQIQSGRTTSQGVRTRPGSLLFVDWKSREK